MSAIQLNAAQWRDMVMGNLSRVLSYVQIQTNLGPQDAVAMQLTLSQTASFIGAWEKASQQQSKQEVPHEGVKAHENGAGSAAAQPVVRKRRGRPPKAKQTGAEA